jgi:hypothetical protein
MIADLLGNLRADSSASSNSVVSGKSIHLGSNLGQDLNQGRSFGTMFLFGMGPPPAISIHESSLFSTGIPINIFRSGHLF